MVDLDVDAGIGVITQLLSDYQAGKVKRDDAASQLLTLMDEATQALDLTGDDRKSIEVYVMTLLRKLELHEIDPDTAAGDLAELRREAELNRSDLAELIEIGQE